MKTLILSMILSLVSVLAHAETITLSPTACTATNICFNVVNDGVNADSTAVVIEYVNYSSNHKRLNVSIDGTLYDSGVGVVTGPLTNVSLYDADGAVIYVTVSFFTVHKPCVRSGKVTICPVVITLTGGTIQR